VQAGDRSAARQIRNAREESSQEEADDSRRDTTQERLAQVLSTFATLRQDGQALIQRIHTTLQEMRELRQQIREQRTTRTAERQDGLAPARTAYLQTRFGLTALESQVALLLAQGRSKVAIAKALGISAHTARHHTQRVLGKLKVHSRAEAGAKLRG
jgi:DNA-binding NarL/FixJ family response regulator